MSGLSDCRLPWQNAIGAVMFPSLNYEGAPVGLAWDGGTPLAEEEHPSFILRRMEYRFGEGQVALRLTLREYRRFPFAEMLPELVCLGDGPTGILSDIQPLSLDLPCPDGAPVTVRTLSGTVNRATDFMPHTTRLAPDGQRELVLDTQEGRSSAAWLPFVGLDSDDLHGLELGIGWSGAWTCRVWLDSDGLHLRAGMRRTHLRLRPGETLRQPSVLLMRRDGLTVRAFKTLLHRFMMEEKSPRDAQGRLFRPCLPITTGGGNKSPKTMLRVLDYARRQQLPFDTLWVDAGWNGPEHHPEPNSNCGDQWWKYVGDWRFNPAVHPDGSLRAVADAAHAQGLRFLLWFEPERCRRGMSIADEHPEFFLTHHGPDGQPDDNLLLNLGLPQARQWALDTVSDHIRASAVDVYRQDFNLNPLPYWDEADAEDRIGIAEATHIAGLYAFWDELRRRFPNLLIENCASGGRRLDFELISRSHSYCRTDYAIGCRHSLDQVLNVQNITLNILPYQPFQGSETTPAEIFDDYGFFSSVCAASVFTPNDWDGGVTRRDFTDNENAWFRQVFAAADRMRDAFRGDFHPLTDPTTLARDVWCAYQCHRPDRDAGFYLVFRRPDCASPLLELSLEGCAPDGLYEMEAYSGRTWRVTGSALRRMLVTIPDPRGFELGFYRRVDAHLLTV